VEAAGIEPASCLVSIVVSTLLVSCVHTTNKVIRFIGVRWAYHHFTFNSRSEPSI